MLNLILPEHNKRIKLKNNAWFVASETSPHKVDAHLTEYFCRETVKRAEQPGNTNASVAREFGISAQQIYC